MSCISHLTVIYPQLQVWVHSKEVGFSLFSHNVLLRFQGGFLICHFPLYSPPLSFLLLTFSVLH